MHRENALKSIFQDILLKLGICSKNMHAKSNYIVDCNVSGQ